MWRSPRLSSLLLCTAVFGACAADGERRSRSYEESRVDTTKQDPGPPHSVPSDDGSDYLFASNKIRVFELEIPAQSLSALDREARETVDAAPYCANLVRHYHTGALRFEGQTFAGVGVRIKGCGSARTLDRKASFKVHLAWDDPDEPGCPKERRLYGQKRLVFNSAVQDPTLVHEALGYGLYRSAGVPAPRAGHVELRVNGESWGLYVLVESIDRRFLSRWFSNNDGMMYEASYECDLRPENVPPDDRDSTCLRREFVPDACDDPDDDADPQTYDLLRQLVGAIADLPRGSFYPAVEAFVDFDTLLSSWAVDSVIANWDGYPFFVTNNYRVYHNPDGGRWTIIPTGIDQTFEDDRDPFGVDGILARRCRDETACETAFAQRLAEVNELFVAKRLDMESERLRAHIADYVAHDSRGEFSYREFEDAHRLLRTWIQTRPHRIRDYLGMRGY